MLGIGIAGCITALIPDGMVEKYLGTGFLSLVLMLAVGMPVFVCATSSTPVVAALALKGLSPGAALVFLLAGPVTNAATITVLVRILGKKVTGIYVAVISVISLLLGTVVNYLYAFLSISPANWVQGSFEEHVSLLSMLMSVLLILLIIRSVKPNLKAKFTHKASCICLSR